MSASVCTAHIWVDRVSADRQAGFGHYIFCVYISDQDAAGGFFSYVLSLRYPAKGRDNYCIIYHVSFADKRRRVLFFKSDPSGVWLGLSYPYQIRQKHTFFL